MSKFLPRNVIFFQFDIFEVFDPLKDQQSVTTLHRVTQKHIVAKSETENVSIRIRQHGLIQSLKFIVLISFFVTEMSHCEDRVDPDSLEDDEVAAIVVRFNLIYKISIFSLFRQHENNFLWYTLGMHQEPKKSIGIGGGA